MSTRADGRRTRSQARSEAPAGWGSLPEELQADIVAQAATGIWEHRSRLDLVCKSWRRMFQSRAFEGRTLYLRMEDIAARFDQAHGRRDLGALRLSLVRTLHHVAPSVTSVAIFPQPYRSPRERSPFEADLLLLLHSTVRLEVHEWLWPGLAALLLWGWLPRLETIALRSIQYTDPSSLQPEPAHMVEEWRAAWRDGVVPKIRELDLCCTELAEGEERCLAPLTALQRLTLVDWALEYLGDAPLDYCPLRGMQELTSMSLVDADTLEAHVPELLTLTQLQELHLLNLESFSPGLAQLSSLVELDLWSSVDDEHLPTLWRCSSLTQLGLAQEESSSYSAGVLEHAHLPRLQRLSLRHARFPDGTFPPALCVLLPQLSSLTISGAGSWWLPPEISLLTALQELTCSGALQGMRARGQQQRAALAALTALTALTLSEGVVKQGVMPGWAVQLPLLRHVYLPGCQLETLLRKGSRTSADERAWLRRLRRLDLTNNKLLRVPPELEQCTSLEHLSLDNNYDVLGSDMEVLQVTLEDARMLAALTSLTRLDVGTSAFYGMRPSPHTTRAVHEFQRLRPDVAVVQVAP